MKVAVAIVVAGLVILGSFNSYQLLQANRTVADQAATIAEQSASLDSYVKQVAALEAKTAEAAGVDPNVWTTQFARAFCAQDAQGLYDSLANGSNTKNGLQGEADYYAQVIDSETQLAANIIVEAGQASGTDVTAMLAALDAKAATLKAANNPVAIVASEIKLPDGVSCTMTFKGSFTDKYGGYSAVYVITYTSSDPAAEPKTWSNFFVLSAGNGGVDGIQ